MQDLDRRVDYKEGWLLLGKAEIVEETNGRDTIVPFLSLESLLNECIFKSPDVKLLNWNIWEH